MAVINVKVESMAETFEQQARESGKAFEAFSVYLNMGVERSLAAVGKKLGKSVGLMERWSRKFDWPARVQAHEAHLATVEREATEALARGKAAEWLKRQQDVREREWEMHEKCIAAAQKAFAAFMAREKVYANLADIARMLEVASKLGRLASGLATDKTETEVSGEVSGTIRVELELALRKIYGTQAGCGHQERAIEVESEKLRVESASAPEGGRSALPEPRARGLTGSDEGKIPLEAKAFGQSLLTSSPTQEEQ